MIVGIVKGYIVKKAIGILGNSGVINEPPTMYGVLGQLDDAKG